MLADNVGKYVNEYRKRELYLPAITWHKPIL